MFNPEWLGKIDWKKGLYASKNRENKDNQIINNINENTINENNKDNKDNKDNKEELNTINNETQFNFNKDINLDIPYYNETINYMNSKVSKKES